MAQKHHRMSLKWLRPFFDLPARPAKSLFFVKISKWPKMVNFHPIWVHFSNTGGLRSENLSILELRYTVFSFYHY